MELLAKSVLIIRPFEGRVQDLFSKVSRQSRNVPHLGKVEMSRLIRKYEARTVPIRACTLKSFPRGYTPDRWQQAGVLGRFLEQALIHLQAERNGGGDQVGIFVALKRCAARRQRVAHLVDRHSLERTARSHRQHQAGGTESQRSAQPTICYVRYRID